VLTGLTVFYTDYIVCTETSSPWWLSRSWTLSSTRGYGYGYGYYGNYLIFLGEIGNSLRE